MNTSRLQALRKPRPILYLGVSRMLWTGALVIGAVILGVLYCLLTHRVPI